MSYFSEIKNALSSLNIPITTDFQGGGYDTYITMVEAADYGRDHGDDIPGFNVTSIQVHFFCPMPFDYLVIKNEIRKRIFKTGLFTYPDVTIFTDRELGVRQIVYEFDAYEKANL